MRTYLCTAFLLSSTTDIYQYIPSNTPRSQIPLTLAYCIQNLLPIDVFRSILISALGVYLLFVWTNIFIVAFRRLLK